jgi:tetratricopeptide (TPR) repeat protein
MEVRDRLMDGLRKAGPSALLLSMEMIERSDRGDHLGAAQTAQKLLEMEPENYHFQYLLSQQFQLARKHAEAIEVLREVARRGGPFKLLAVNDLAYLVAEFKPDEMESAHAMALKAFEVAPNNMPLLDTIGWIEHLSGNDERALEHLSKAVIGLKELPEVHYHLGVVYRGLSNKTGDNNYRTWARYHLEQAALGPADRREVQQARAQLAAFAPAR